ncbi:endonuclease [Mycobacterium shigaense]|uniref:Endonuclease n=1 Tax=Mycobacterium shigaense TaxID=722731 RepID=A0A1Z4EIP7_9MYCO|nr:endonuclease [Mycobacterium shigaense]
MHEQYSDDLREIAESSRHEVAAAKRMLKKFKGIGDTGADIYLREVQDTWTWVRPYFDDRARAAAKTLGLPTDAEALGKLSPRNNARLAAALVRISLDDDLRRQVVG